MQSLSMCSGSCRVVARRQAQAPAARTGVACRGLKVGIYPSSASRACRLVQTMFMLGHAWDAWAGMLSSPTAPRPKHHGEPQQASPLGGRGQRGSQTLVKFRHPRPATRTTSPHVRACAQPAGPQPGMPTHVVLRHAHVQPCTCHIQRPHAACAARPHAQLLLLGRPCAPKP